MDAVFGACGWTLESADDGRPILEEGGIGGAFVVFLDLEAGCAEGFGPSGEMDIVVAHLHAAGGEEFAFGDGTTSGLFNGGADGLEEGFPGGRWSFHERGSLMPRGGFARKKRVFSPWRGKRTERTEGTQGT